MSNINSSVTSFIPDTVGPDAAYLLTPAGSQTGTLKSGQVQKWTTNGSVEIVHMANTAGVAEFGLYGTLFDYTSIHAQVGSTNSYVMSWSTSAKNWQALPLGSVTGSLIGKTAGTTLSLTALGAGAAGITSVGGATTVTGALDTFIGFNAGHVATSATLNVGVGAYALQALTTGSNNTVVGYQAANALTTATDVTAIGYQAAYANTSTYITAVGSGALASNVTGTANTAVGYFALNANTGNANTAMGYVCLESNTSGVNNTAFGSGAMELNTTGGQNVAVGNNALVTNTTGSYNTAIGLQALDLNSTGSYSTAVGVSALYHSTAGTNNALGYQALYSLTTGTPNDAFGYQALYALTTGFSNVAIGYQAGKSMTSGTDNTAVGYQALMSVLGSVESCAFGEGSLATATASNNDAFGYYALNLQTTGVGNTAFGGFSLESSTGSYNAAFGYYALNAATTVGYNSAFGAYAIYVSTTGQYNSGLGYQVMYSLTTGSNNAGVGYQAAGLLTGGGSNTAVGYKAGVPATAANSLKTASNTIFIGDDTGFGSSTQNNYAGAIGSQAVVYAANLIVLGSQNGVNGATATVGIATPGGIGIGYTNQTSAPAANTLQFYNAGLVSLASNTPSALQFTDGTNAWAVINTQTGTSGAAALTISPNGGGVKGPTFASALGSSYNSVSLSAYTLTLTGGVAVTALNGIQMTVGQPTVTSASATTVTTASALYLKGNPIAGGSVTITRPYTILVDNGGVIGLNSSGGTTSMYTDASGNLSLSATGNTIGLPSQNQIGFQIGSVVNNAYLGNFLQPTGTIVGFSAPNHILWFMDFVNYANTPTLFTLQVGVTASTGVFYNINSQTATDGTKTHEFQQGTTISYAAAAGSSHSLMALDAYTLTFTGTTGTTAMNGMMLNIAQPTLSNASAQTTTTASAMYLAGAVIPTGAGPETLTNSYALHVNNGTLTASAATTITTAASLFIGGAPAAGANVTITNPYALYVAAGTSLLQATKFGGQLTSNTAQTWALPATTGSALNITDGTSSYLLITTGALGTGFTQINTAGLQIGGVAGTGATANQIWTASQGAASTQLFIGNASINVTSDMRLKEVLGPTTRSATDIFRSLQVVDFRWNDPSDAAPVNRNSRGIWMGITAQQAIQYVPWLVNAEDRNCTVCLTGGTCSRHSSMWNVDWSHEFGLVTLGFQEVYKRFETAEEKIIRLEARVAELEARAP